MHKQLTLLLTLISSLSSAQIPTQKIEDLKAQAKQEALEKHLAEKEQAKSDLKKSAGAVAAFTIIGEGWPFLQKSTGLKDTAFMNYKIESLGSTPVAFWAFLAWVGVEAGIACYGIYKGGKGIKHLLIPNHPKPEETFTKKDSHA